jgi:hypothetical protein
MAIIPVRVLALGLKDYDEWPNLFFPYSVAGRAAAGNNVGIDY